MWTDERHNRFEEDLELAGYDVVEYHGRYHYHGPAVKCESNALQDVLRATPVRVVWDTLGKTGLVVYPDCRQRISDQKDMLEFNNALKDLGVEFPKDA